MSYSQSSTSSSRRHASHSSSHSAGSSSHHPFRSHARDNLPSFSECFAGFHRTDQLGEHHIAAASPQQQWSHNRVTGSPAASRGGSSYGGGSRVHTPSQQAMQSGGAAAAALTPLHLTPRRSPDNRRPDSPHALAAAQLQSNADANFSYRTIDALSDEESADDPVHVQPREIERDNSDEWGTEEGGAFSTEKRSPPGTERSSDAYQEQQTPKNIRRPPLHPNVSPILSPQTKAFYDNRPAVSPRRADSAGSPPPARENYISPRRGEQRSSAAHVEDRATGTRPPRTLEELAIKHLFPLFGEFLRSLPAKHLEEFLLHGDGERDEGGVWGHRSSRSSSSAAFTPLSDIRSAVRDADNARLSRAACRSVEQRVAQIVPSYNDLLDPGAYGRFGGVSGGTSFRDFAYHHPCFDSSLAARGGFRSSASLIVGAARY